MTCHSSRAEKTGVEPRTAQCSKQDAREAGSRRIAVYRLTGALRDFGWTPVAAPTGHGEADCGTWTSPTGTARLALRGPDDEVPAEILRVEVTGGLDTSRPWRLSGVWLPDLVPALLAAAVQTSWPAPDPIAALQGDWWREHYISRPPGEFYVDRYLQSDGTERGVIDEIIWCISAEESQDPDYACGWHLCVAYGFDLHADLATPRHVVTALAIALNCAEHRYRWP